MFPFVDTAGGHYAAAGTDQHRATIFSRSPGRLVTAAAKCFCTEARALLGQLPPTVVDGKWTQSGHGCRGTMFRPSGNRKKLARHSYEFVTHNYPSSELGCEKWDLPFVNIMSLLIVLR
jgi:hypothetical protein